MALHHRSTTTRASRAEAAAAEIRESGGRAIAVGADLHSTDLIASMIERVTSELGPVEVLVTATSAYRTERFAEISDASWAVALDALLGATFRTCRTVVPAMQTPAGAGS